MNGYNSVIIPGTITKTPVLKDEFLLQFSIVTTRTVNNRKENTVREEVIPLIIQIEGEEAPQLKETLKEGMKVIIAGSLQYQKGNKKLTHIVLTECIHYGAEIIDMKECG